MGTVVKSENITKRFGETAIRTIRVSEYVNVGNFAEECINNSEFIKALSTWGTEIDTGVKYKKGGLGVVCKCTNNSMLKIVSFKNSFKNLNGQSEKFFDLCGEPSTDANDHTQRMLLQMILKRESYIYSLLTDKQKDSLADPFIIRVCDGEDVVDYFICVNMPIFKPIDSVIKNDLYDEKQLLKMVYDILGCLVMAHNEGMRHRDVKTENIMYDETSNKFILVDWGSSCIKSDINAMQDALGINISVKSECYIDPVYDINKKGLKPSVDIYPIGVVMAYFSHPDGYRCGNNIIEFHSKVCPDKIHDGLRFITPDIYEELTDSSNRYCDLVKKSMNYEYETAEEMRQDIEDILEINKEEKGVSVTEPSFMEKKIRINAFLGIIPALLIVLFTMLFTKEGGFYAVGYNDSGVGVSVLLTIFCVLIPILIALLKNSAGNRKLFSIELKVKTLITGAVLFIASLLATNITLYGLSEYSSLDMNCTLYLISWVLTWILTKINLKNKVGNILLKCLFFGVFGGVSSGICIASGLVRGNLSMIFSVESIGLICSVVLLFTVCALCVFYFLYKILTRGVKVTEFN